MHIVLWVLLCLLASAGIVQTLSWVVCRLGQPGRTGRAYQVIPLEREPGPLEEQLRYELHLLRWSSAPRPAPLVLLDTGMSDEARQICRNLLCDVSDVVVCAPGELPELICRAEHVIRVVTKLN